MCSGLESLLGRIDRMIRSVIKSSLYADNRISGKRALGNGLCKSLLNCRIIVLRYSTADDFNSELIRLCLIFARLEAHLYVTILAMSTGLLLILTFNIRFLTDRLTESDLRLKELDINFIALFQLALDNLELLLADTVNK